MTTPWSRLSLSTKIAAAILGIFLLSTAVLFLIQQRLYAYSFNAVLGDLERSVLELKRTAAQDVFQVSKDQINGMLSE